MVCDEVLCTTAADAGAWSDRSGPPVDSPDTGERSIRTIALYTCPDAHRQGSCGHWMRRIPASRVRKGTGWPRGLPPHHMRTVSLPTVDLYGAGRYGSHATMRPSFATLRPASRFGPSRYSRGLAGTVYLRAGLASGRDTAVPYPSTNGKVGHHLGPLLNLGSMFASGTR